MTSIDKISTNLSEYEACEDTESSVMATSQMVNLLDEFTKIYTDRLNRVEDSASKCNESEYLQNKVKVLESWVRDLGDQNQVLVTTVEELEKEAADRVALLQDKLNKMAITTRESCISLRDHHAQVSSVMSDKVDLKKQLDKLREDLLLLEKSSSGLRQENNNINNDLWNLVQIASHAYQTGAWEFDDYIFYGISLNQIFGSTSISRPISSPSVKTSRNNFFSNIESPQSCKNSTSNSFANINELESLYTSPDSSKDMFITKLKAEINLHKESNEQTNKQIINRDKHIAELQIQLTDLHHQLSQLHKQDNDNYNYKSRINVYQNQLSFTKAETQLNENIDVLLDRLENLESECQTLRDQYSNLQDTHSHCSSSINALRKQLNVSKQNSQRDVEVMTEQNVNNREEDQRSNLSIQMLKLENEVTEKNILIRELQNHLASSRQEMHLKDETLTKVETKLDSSRREGGHREDRLQYLTSQLTHLQLEIAKTHGHSEQLRKQVENKNELIKKLEYENFSLSHQLNNKSANIETLQKELNIASMEVDNLRKQIRDQKLTITTLQDSLVATKQTCDRMRLQMNPDVSAAASLSVYSLPPLFNDACQSINSSGPNKQYHFNSIASLNTDTNTSSFSNYDLNDNTSKQTYKQTNKYTSNYKPGLTDTRSFKNTYASLSPKNNGAFNFQLNNKKYNTGPTSLNIINDTINHNSKSFNLDYDVNKLTNEDITSSPIACESIKIGQDFTNFDNSLGSLDSIDSDQNYSSLPPVLGASFPPLKSKPPDVLSSVLSDRNLTSSILGERKLKSIRSVGRVHHV